jgi:hypothetical protein
VTATGLSTSTAQSASRARTHLAFTLMAMDGAVNYDLVSVWPPSTSDESA